MATTKARTEANRNNAALSTGPSTPEGKAVSSQNGATHGLSSARISPLDTAGRARAGELRAGYAADYKPTGPVEGDLIMDMATARVRINKIEHELATLETEHWEDPAADRYQLYSRYLRDAHRSYDRCRRVLEAVRLSQARETLATAAAVARILLSKSRRLSRLGPNWLRFVGA